MLLHGRISKKTDAKLKKKKKAFHIKVHLCEMFRKGKYEDVQKEEKNFQLK